MKLNMLRAVIVAVAIALPCPVSAQSSPGWGFGFVPTPGQWNAAFAAKQDALGYTPLNIAGGTMTGELVTTPSVSLSAGFNIPPGVAPGSPVNGDIWETSSGIFAQINGTTIGPLSGATSSSFGNTSPITVSFSSGIVTYACPTCGVTGNPLSQFSTTTSTQLRSIISDPTGSGAAVFGTSPTIASPTFSGTITAAAANFSGTVNNTGAFQISGVAQIFPASGLLVGTTETQSLTNKTLGSSTDVLGGVTMTMGSDATGDIYFRNAGGLLTRLAIGGSANILTVSGGLPSWAAPTGGGNVSNTGTPTANQIAQWTNATTIQGVNLASLLTAGAGIAISGTTSPTIAQSLTNATLQASLGNPTGTTSATQVMMGFGTTCKLTPVYSTRVQLRFQGNLNNSTSTGSSQAQARFGTGAAPANAAAATGTTVGNAQTALNPGGTTPFSVGGIITGLSVGTAIWFDIGLSDAIAGTATIANASCEAIEF